MARIRPDLQIQKSTTAGSLLISNATNDYNHIAPGANGTVLTVVGGVPTYQAITFPSEYEQFANEAARPATGVADVIYFAQAEGTFSIWNGTAYTQVPGATTFTVAGDSGTAQTIGGGNTLTIAANRGFATVASATDTITIAPPAGTVTGQLMAWDQTAGTWAAATPAAAPVFARDNFTLTAGQTTAVAAQTPIAGSVEVYRNGLLENLTTDYTIAGTTVTLLTAGAAGETVSLLYRV